MDKAAKDKSYWERSKGFSGMLSNPLLQGGLGILGANGNQWAGGLLGGLEQAGKYRQEEEDREERERRLALEEGRQATADERAAQEFDWKAEERANRERQIAMLTGGGDQQLAQQSPVDTRTADISGGLFGGMNPQQSPAQEQVGGILGAQPDIQQMIQARALTDPEGASQMAMQYSMQQQQTAQAEANQAAQYKQQIALQNRGFGNQQSLADVNLEKSKAQYDSRIGVQEAKEQAKIDAKKEEKNAKVKTDFDKIKDSEVALLSMLKKDNFSDAVGTFDSKFARLSPLSTKDKQLEGQATRISGKSIIDVISSATFGSLSDGERQMIQKTVPTSSEDPAQWVDWYNDEYLPRRNRVARESGNPEAKPLELYDQGMFGGLTGGGKIREVGSGQEEDGFYTEKQKGIMERYRGN